MSTDNDTDLRVQASEALEGTLVTKANVKNYARSLVSIGDSADVPPSLR